MKLQSTIFLTLSAVAPIISKGINCQGSSDCSGLAFSLASLSDICNNLCSHIDDTVRSNGYHLAESCNNVKEGLAAFYQGTPNGGSTRMACTLCRRLEDHGCEACGSAPLVDNDISLGGELTVNAVVGSCNAPCTVNCPS
ncbi:hypothetical protein DL98DRAFT_598075 [Cadophora sp. DSE1049]|nr:hypothetical protein DL98DRAFT_598075 [Cadophora sp. DSE1049]